MAGRAILGDAGAVFGHVVAIVAAEAAGILLVADVVGMSSPGDFHVREHILAVQTVQFLSGIFHERGFFGEDFGMLAAIEGFELLRNLDSRFILGVVGILQQRQAFLVDEGQRGADDARGHGAVDGFFRGDEGMRGAVVAVDAVHHAPLALGLCAVEGRGGIGSQSAIGIGALHPWNRRTRGVGRDVFDVAEVHAVNAAALRE